MGHRVLVDLIDLVFSGFHIVPKVSCVFAIFTPYTSHLLLLGNYKLQSSLTSL